MSSIQHNSIEADAILTELRERCAYYERTNVLQGEMLNEAIAERDEVRHQLTAMQTAQHQAIALAAFNKHEAEKWHDAAAACQQERDDYRAALKIIQSIVTPLSYAAGYTAMKTTANRILAKYPHEEKP